MMRRIAAGVVVLALAGCATPAQRIAATLGDYGVPPGQARCMGERLQARLSVAQLRRLEAIGRGNGENTGRMSVTEIAGKLTDPRDPALVAEFVRAGIGCAL
jgi:hypothetical protein